MDPTLPSTSAREQHALRVFAEASAQPLIVVDEGDRCAYLNPAARTFLGGDSAPAPGEPLRIDRSGDRITLDAGGGVRVPVTERPLGSDGARSGAVLEVIAADDGTGPESSALQPRDRLVVAEMNYRRLVETSPLTIYAVDREGRILHLNPAGERLLGRPIGELIGHRFDVVVAPGSGAEAEAAFARIISGEANDLEYEMEVLRPSGELRSIVATSSALGEGTIVGVHGVARDVTDQKRAEAALEARERHFRQILDAMPVGALLADSDGQIVWHNAAGRAIWGGERLVGLDRYGEYRGWWADTGERIAGEEWALARALQGTVVTGDIVDIEAFDGARRTILNSAVPLRDEAGRISGAVVVHEDITEARAREAPARLLAAAVHGLSEGVALVGLDGAVLFENRAFARILGYEPGSVDGLDIARFAVESGEPRTTPAEGWSGRIRRRRLDDGREVVLEATIGQADGRAGMPAVRFEIIRDVTEQIRSEDHLRRAERLATLGTLVGGVAHELNNPLSAIVGFTQLLLLETLPPSVRDDLETIRREADRMARIVADLRNLARESQDPSGPLERVDLNGVVRHVVKTRGYHLSTHNIEVRVELEDGLRPVLGRGSELEQVILNLVVNAEHAMKGVDRERRLTLRTRSAASGVAVHVIDTGRGIASEDLERVFDPFFTTKAPGEGTGLGLSMVNTIIAELGGRIHLDSRVDRGSSFSVHLPAAAPDDRSPDSESPVAEPAVAATLRVLVVDDEAAVRGVVKRYLTLRGHAVEEASDGSRALEMLEANEQGFDVVLSDLRMPGVGGDQLLRRLRERGDPTAERFIFLTGDTASGHADALQGESRVPILTKPIDLAMLARILEDFAAAR